MKRQSMKAIAEARRFVPDDYDPLAWQAELQQTIIDRFGEHPNTAAGKADDVGHLTNVVLANVTAIQQELAEMVDYLPWKWWKKYGSETSSTPVDQYEELVELIFEAIDVQHFLNNIYLALGMTWQDVLSAYHSKQMENRRRQTDGY